MLIIITILNLEKELDNITFKFIQKMNFINKQFLLFFNDYNQKINEINSSKIIFSKSFPLDYLFNC